MNRRFAPLFGGCALASLAQKDFTGGSDEEDEIAMKMREYATLKGKRFSRGFMEAVRITFT